jgi:hypothetical protein
MWVMEKSGSNWNIKQIEGYRSVNLGWVSDEAFAERIVNLMNRHGLEDVALDDIEPSDLGQ